MNVSQLRWNSLGSETYMNSKGQKVLEAKAQDMLVVQPTGGCSSKNKAEWDSKEGIYKIQSLFLPEI